MEKLIAELTRLYLAPEAVTREALAQHILGKTTLAIKLTTADGLTRALAIPFRKVFGDGETGHWERLCAVANALQAELGLPVPAVSIDGANAYRLWLSLETPVAADQAQDFLELLRQAYFPGARAGARRRHRAGLPAALPEPAQRQVGGLHPSGHGRVLCRGVGVGDDTAAGGAGRFPGGAGQHRRSAVPPGAAQA
jgi:hypothetical protein